MTEQYDRIRRARAISRLTQAQLAKRVGVVRSAVAQWEHKGGSHPSMEHLAAIATETGVSIEWLGTGRGGPSLDSDDWAAAVCQNDFVQDTMESACLGYFRKMPTAVKKQILSIMELASRNF